MELTVDFISEHWPLDHVTETIPQKQGEGRGVFAIRSAQGSFIVKVYEGPGACHHPCPTQEEIGQFLYVYEYLRQKDFGHTPALLKSRSGESFWRGDNRTVFIMEQLQGTNPPDSPETWAELGRLAARINSYTDYPYDFLFSVDAVIADLTRQAEEYPFKHEFLELVAELEALVGQPVSLIHTEIGPHNSLLTPDGKMYILDCDGIGTGPTVLEPGYPLICTFICEEQLTFRDHWAAAYYEAYTAGAGMTDDEKNLVFTAALLHALRFMPMGNTTMQRWAQICYGLENKKRLLSTIPAKHASS